MDSTKALVCDSHLLSSATPCSSSTTAAVPSAQVLSKPSSSSAPLSTGVVSSVATTPTHSSTPVPISFSGTVRGCELAASSTSTTTLSSGGGAIPASVELAGVLGNSLSVEGRLCSNSGVASDSGISSQGIQCSTASSSALSSACTTTTISATTVACVSGEPTVALTSPTASLALPTFQQPLVESSGNTSLDSNSEGIEQAECVSSKEVFMDSVKQVDSEKLFCDIIKRSTEKLAPPKEEQSQGLFTSSTDHSVDIPLSVSSRSQIPDCLASVGDSAKQSEENSSSSSNAIASLGNSIAMPVQENVGGLIGNGQKRRSCEEGDAMKPAVDASCAQMNSAPNESARKNSVTGGGKVVKKSRNQAGSKDSSVNSNGDGMSVAGATNENRKKGPVKKNPSGTRRGSNSSAGKGNLKRTSLKKEPGFYHDKRNNGASASFMTNSNSGSSWNASHLAENSSTCATASMVAPNTLFDNSLVSNTSVVDSYSVNGDMSGGNIPFYGRNYGYLNAGGNGGDKVKESIEEETNHVGSYLNLCGTKNGRSNGNEQNRDENSDVKALNDSAQVGDPSRALGSLLGVEAIDSQTHSGFGNGDGSVLGGHLHQAGSQQYYPGPHANTASMNAAMLRQSQYQAMEIVNLARNLYECCGKDLGRLSKIIKYAVEGDAATSEGGSNYSCHVKMYWEDRSRSGLTGVSSSSYGGNQQQTSGEQGKQKKTKLCSTSGSAHAPSSWGIVGDPYSIPGTPAPPGSFLEYECHQNSRYGLGAEQAHQYGNGYAPYMQQQQGQEQPFVVGNSQFVYQGNGNILRDVNSVKQTHPESESGSGLISSADVNGRSNSTQPYYQHGPNNGIIYAGNQFCDPSMLSDVQSSAQMGATNGSNNVMDSSNDAYNTHSIGQPSSSSSLTEKISRTTKSEPSKPEPSGGKSAKAMQTFKGQASSTKEGQRQRQRNGRGSGGSVRSAGRSHSNLSSKKVAIASQPSVSSLDVLPGPRRLDANGIPADLGISLVPKTSSEQGSVSFYGFISNLGDARHLFQAALDGKCRLVKQRLNEADRKLIKVGQGYIYDEVDSGIKRWTDGIDWKDSYWQCNNQAMLYKEAGYEEAIENGEYQRRKIEKPNGFRKLLIADLNTKMRVICYFHEKDLIESRKNSERRMSAASSANASKVSSPVMNPDGILKSHSNASGMGALERSESNLSQYARLNAAVSTSADDVMDKRKVQRSSTSTSQSKPSGNRSKRSARSSKSSSSTDSKQKSNFDRESCLNQLRKEYISSVDHTPEEISINEEKLMEDEGFEGSTASDIRMTQALMMRKKRQQLLQQQREMVMGDHGLLPHQRNAFSPKDPAHVYSVFPPPAGNYSHMPSLHNPPARPHTASSNNTAPPGASSSSNVTSSGSYVATPNAEVNSNKGIASYHASLQDSVGTGQSPDPSPVSISSAPSHQQHHHYAQTASSTTAVVDQAYAQIHQHSHNRMTNNGSNNNRSSSTSSSAMKMAPGTKNTPANGNNSLHRHASASASSSSSSIPAPPAPPTSAPVALKEVPFDGNTTSHGPSSEAHEEATKYSNGGA
eukprot:Nk52_evm5s163 gene=Nk52_evmTU5s163